MVATAGAALGSPLLPGITQAASKVSGGGPKRVIFFLQNQGFDTVEANHRLGFEDDERDFRLGAAMLRRMGFSAVRLMTNNPRKVAMMQAHGIEVVERAIWPEELESFEQFFLTGSAAEVTPVKSAGPWNFEVGDLSRQLARDYDDLVNGRQA